VSIVWDDMCDERWHCVVTAAEDPYRGTLTVTDTNEPYEVILTEEVGIMFGAPFGPDQADVSTWTSSCIRAVDLYYEEHK